MTAEVVISLTWPRRLLQAQEFSPWLFLLHSPEAPGPLTGTQHLKVREAPTGAASSLAHLSVLPFRQRFFTKLCQAQGMPGGARGHSTVGKSVHCSACGWREVLGGGVVPQPNLKNVGTEWAAWTGHSQAEAGRQNRKGASAGRSWDGRPMRPFSSCTTTSLPSLIRCVSALELLWRFWGAW